MSEDDFVAVVGRLKTGDRAAMDALFREYGGVVRAAVRRQLHDDLRPQFDSLDFVQDVWASLAQLPPARCDFATPAALAGFLAAVARNKVTDVFRQRTRTRKYDLARERPDRGTPDGDGPESAHAGLAGRGPTPSLEAIAAEQWAALLSALPPAHRLILERLREGYTHAEVAARAGVNVRTVERVVSRLRQTLTGAGDR